MTHKTQRKSLTDTSVELLFVYKISLKLRTINFDSPIMRYYHFSLACTKNIVLNIFWDYFGGNLITLDLCWH